LHAQTHLTFGRLEAKVGHFAATTRHFELARKLLADDPNEQLSASLDVDESVVLWLIGDLGGALALAERGATAASEIGWSRGCAAARANLACLYVAAGRLADAQQQIYAAKRERFSSPSLSHALSDTAARALIAERRFEEAHKLLSQVLEDTNPQPWYKLSAQQTLVRLLGSEGRWDDAVLMADEGIQGARNARLVPIEKSLLLAKLEGMIEANIEIDSELFDAAATLLDSPINLQASFHRILGKALLKLDRWSRGASEIVRAARFLDGSGDLLASRELEESGVLPASPEVQQPGEINSLDAAVALLELSGHPQILAREAFALLQDSGCAEALALATTGPRGVTIVAAEGWTAGEALAAVRAAEPDDLIAAGQHRDEMWQILARPRAALDHRCTLAAIRKLVAAARTLEAYRRDEKQRAALWPAEALDGDAESLWISEQSAELLSIARRIASAPLPILLTGETGTGKEMLARVIHRASDRADRPMHPFNCTAVPRDMLDSQLFGYRKGAFTGADASFSGVIRAAAGGTLFLDEIGDVGLDLQPKLLRFLEQQEVQPIGEPQPVKVDVRIIAATNANLEQLVAQGRFREDLLYRLNVLRLHLPPLRERREEIPPLVQHYIRKFGDEQRKGRLTLGDETLEYLLLYAWPGNIRQLANEVRRMIALAEPDATLTPAMLSPEIQASRRTIATPPVAEPEIRLRLDQRLPDAVEMLEQTLVRRALERSHGRVEEAARLLGISRKGLFLKRRRWGLHAES
jgi:DNA-binding NtrC family response regulator